LPISAYAGPPVLTDDTGTPGPGKWEINAGFTMDKRETEDRFNTPVLDINYGIGEHFQLNYSISWVELDTKDVGTKNGLGNSEIAVKWRFVDEERHGIAMSVYPRIIFNNPTSSADRGLVDKGYTFLMPFQMEKRIGKVTVNTEFGRAFRRHKGDRWIYGFVLKSRPLRQLETLAEIHGTADNEFKRHETVFNLGARWDIGKNYALLASAGRSFHSATDQPSFLSYLGAQFRF
jgi:hypothetical protein